MEFNELKTLEAIEAELSEALEYELLNDRAYLRHFKILEKRWKIVHKAVKRLRKLQKEEA